MICTTACVTAITIPKIAEDNCGQIQPRDEKWSKLFLIRCDIGIPSGNDTAIAAALTTLLDAGKIGASPRLKNFAFGDPQTADQQFADCDAPAKVVTQRDLTWEDWNAFPEHDPEGGLVTEYGDRAFWRTIKKSKKFNYGRTTCDGKLYLFSNEEGTQFLTGTISIFKGEDRTVANKVYEVKKGTITFLGDPEESFPEPFIDLSQHLTLNPTLAQLF
jgi:hypothetical protein